MKNINKSGKYSAIIVCNIQYDSDRTDDRGDDNFYYFYDLINKYIEDKTGFDNYTMQACIKKYKRGDISRIKFEVHNNRPISLKRFIAEIKEISDYDSIELYDSENNEYVDIETLGI